jgi:hypothetical protein
MPSRSYLKKCTDPIAGVALRRGEAGMPGRPNTK